MHSKKKPVIIQIYFDKNGFKELDFL